MAVRQDLQEWVVAALLALGGGGTLVDIARKIWEEHERDLRASGDLFYTWQYDMRWAATRLRQTSTVRASVDSPRGIWQLIR
jgi:hypothetical protein